jgi:hypothetical protein
MDPLASNCIVPPTNLLRRALSISACAAVALLAAAHSEAQTFRLGNAAGPFGWSSAIADFNTDGRPDVAIADHVGTHAGGYRYRIELSMSGQVSDHVTFESVHDAITIIASDIDFDRDLDIIIGVPLTGRTVGVWLNDGDGHFTSADLAQFPPTLQAQQTVAAGRSDVSVLPFDLSPRRVDYGLSRVFDLALPTSCHSACASPGLNLRPSSPSLHIALRGPPIPSLESES